MLSLSRFPVDGDGSARNQIAINQNRFEELRHLVPTD